MTAQSQLEAYLDSFRRRLQALIVARGAALLAAVALVITLVAVYFGIRRAFDHADGLAGLPGLVNSPSR